MTPVPELTDEEMASINELGAILHTLGEAFLAGNGDPKLMFTTVDMIREAADTLESLALRWAEL